MRLLNQKIITPRWKKNVILSRKAHDTVPRFLTKKNVLDTTKISPYLPAPIKIQDAYRNLQRVQSWVTVTIVRGICNLIPKSCRILLGSLYDTNPTFMHHKGNLWRHYHTFAFFDPSKIGNDPCSSAVQSTVTSYSTRHWLLLQLTWVKVAHDPKCWRCHHPRGSNKTWLTVVKCHSVSSAGKWTHASAKLFDKNCSILRLQTLSMSKKILEGVEISSVLTLIRGLSFSSTR